MNGCGGGWQIRIWNQTEEFCDMERALASVRARAGLDTGIPIIYYLVTQAADWNEGKGIQNAEAHPIYHTPLTRLSRSKTDKNIDRRYCLYAQGCPLLIVLVTFGVDSAAKARDDYDTMDIRSTLCF